MNAVSGHGEEGCILTAQYKRDEQRFKQQDTDCCGIERAIEVSVCRSEGYRNYQTHLI